VAEAGLVEAGTDLVDEVGGHPAALRRRVETDPVQPIARACATAKRLLGLVLERVDENDAGTSLPRVAIRRLGRRDRVTEDQDQRVGHGPRRREAGEASARGRGRADAAAEIAA